MRPYDTAIEHLDEVGAWALDLLDRAAAGAARRTRFRHKAAQRAAGATDE